MLFTVCQNSIGKYDFGSVALYAPPLGVTGGQKPGVIRVKQLICTVPSLTRKIRP